VTFNDLLAEATGDRPRFGHREHIHLTWLAVTRYGVAAAIPLVSEGIQQTARYAGAPRKYHATVSRAWVELVGFHIASHPDSDFATWAEANPGLFDKRLLSRFYRATTLATDAARRGWVPPDLVAFPTTQ